jgi:hypothetical protein
MRSPATNCEKSVDIIAGTDFGPADDARSYRGAFEISALETSLEKFLTGADFGITLALDRRGRQCRNI